MALRDWINFTFDHVASAIPAKIAIREEKGGGCLAGIARLALAEQAAKKITHAIEKRLRGDFKGDSLNVLPSWCLMSCPNLEEITLPGGKVFGCTQISVSQEEYWQRLDTFDNCPLLI